MLKLMHQKVNIRMTLSEYRGVTGKLLHKSDKGEQVMMQAISYKTDFAALCAKYELGSLMQPPEPVTGGYMHRLPAQLNRWRTMRHSYLSVWNG